MNSQSVRLPERRRAKKRVSWAPLLERHLAGRIAHERKPGGLPFVLKVMPVSMRVAEFDPITQKRKVNYDATSGKEFVNRLDPTKPVWVVVHGMDSNESEVKINELAKALRNSPDLSDVQIVTVDWNEAAKTFLDLPTAMDVVWTPAVGSWVASQLVGMGFTAENISGVGHSHGTYVLNFMGEELMNKQPGHQMNTLVALDAAGDPPWTGFDENRINFKNVSQRSVAFEIAPAADSNKLAGTADISFKVDVVNELDPGVQHSLGMTLFIEQLKQDAIERNALSNFYGLQKIMALSSQDILGYENNVFSGFAEGYIYANLEWVQIDGKLYPKTTATGLFYRKPGEGTDTLVTPDTVSA